MPLTIASEVLAPSAISLAKRVADVIFHGQLTEMSRPFQQWLSARESEIEFRRALSLALDALRRSDYAIEGRGAIDESLLCHEEFAKLLWSPLLDPESDHEVDITRLAKTYDEVVWGGIADSSSEELRARQREVWDSWLMFYTTRSCGFSPLSRSASRIEYSRNWTRTSHPRSGTTSFAGISIARRDEFERCSKS